MVKEVLNITEEMHSCHVLTVLKFEAYKVMPHQNSEKQISQKDCIIKIPSIVQLFEFVWALAFQPKNTGNKKPRF